MIPYNETDLDNSELQDFAANALRSDLVTKEEFQKITAEHPVRFYSPNIFLRIGLGVLALTVSLAVIGLIYLITDAEELEPILVFMGIASFGALELCIRKWRHYRSGIDDVLLHAGIFYILLFFAITIESDQETRLSAIAFILYSFAALRYLDRLAALLAVGALISLVYQITHHRSDHPGTLVLFIIAGTMVITAYLVHRLQDQSFFKYQVRVLQLVKYAAIIACYGSLHYYIVEQYLRDYAAALNSLPMVWFHLAWTIIIPPAILYFGLQKRLRSWIRIGLGLIIVFFIFWQYDFKPVEHEVAALVYGILLVVVTYFIIKYLEAGKSPFTDEPVSGEPDWAWSETIAVAAGFSGQAAGGGGNMVSGPTLGGGDFGGGGAGGEF